MRRVKALLLGDLKNISRDPILLVSIIAPLLTAIVMRLGLPFAAEMLWQKLQFDLTPYYNLIISIMLLICPFMLGMLAGFIILDERDENILMFFTVTPLTKTGYLAYRMLSPIICCFIMSFVMVYIIGLVSIDFTRLLAVAIVASLEAPMVALFMGAFAANKVEGLAFSKALGILFIAPAVGYFVKSGWQLLAGIAPTYWVSKVFIYGIQGSSLYWVYAIVGVLVHLLFMYALYRKFENKAL